MLPILISLPVLSLMVMFQTAILSRVHLLHGTVDLILLAVLAWALQERVTSAWFWSLIGGLMIGLFTALPFGALLVCYLTLTALALFLKSRIWKAPILAMFVATFVGTLLIHAVSLGLLIFKGTPLPVLDSLNLVTLPSLILNLLLAAPMYVFMGDLASWLYPKEIEV